MRQLQHLNPEGHLWDATSSHTLARMSVAFDDPNLVPPAGLVLVLALAERGGLADLADEHLLERAHGQGARTRG